MWIIVLIILMLFMIFIVCHKTRNKNDIQVDSMNKNICQRGKIECVVNNIIDKTMSCALFENGIVYCCPKNIEKFIIGYYEIKGSKLLVFCNKEKDELIAEIQVNNNSSNIYLSRLGQLNRFEKLGFPKNPPVKLMYLCAESFENIVIDKESGEVVAEFSGSHSEAVAAFACLHYETISKSKYHDFYTVWL